MKSFIKALGAFCFIVGTAAIAVAEKLPIPLGSTSVAFRVALENDDGTPATGLTNASSGLIISTIANNEATATAYTVAASKVETISTLGTYAAPTATKARFKEVDATNHPGIYEIQLADARLAVTNATSLIVTVTGVSGVRPTHAEFHQGTYNANVTKWSGTTVPSTYDGTLSSEETGNVYDLGTSGIDADDQFTNGYRLAFYTTAGLPIASSCITASVAASDRVTVRDDMDALTAPGDNYRILEDGGCVAYLAGTQTANITGNITGNLSGSVGSVTGNVGGNVVGTVASVVTKTGYSIAGTKTTLDALNDISTANVLTQCASALTTYDPPTNTEMVAAFTEIKGGSWSSSTDTLRQIALGGGGGGGGSCDEAAVAEAVWAAIVGDNDDVVGSFGEQLTTALNTNLTCTATRE